MGAGGLGRPPGTDLSGLPGRPAGLGFEPGHVRGVRRDTPVGDARRGGVPGVRSLTTRERGRLAQLEERRPYKAKVGGSRPSAPTVKPQVRGGAAGPSPMRCPRGRAGGAHSARDFGSRRPRGRGDRRPRRVSASRSSNRCAYRFVVTTERCPTRRPASCSDAPEAAMIDTAECRSAYGVVGPMPAAATAGVKYRARHDDHGSLPRSVKGSPAHHRPKQASVRDAEARCRRR